ncbi:SDR family NAD(P)-dependent oxidoreductase [Oceanibacterium hippocampi]|uniref:2-dehydro-3-deoxy-D-gluconate 5-dehydrogenase n=1 Tax=Oceanibacterium hippocampi TaxID=745714 RepID=A0A1Y5SH62_9PROT|nr:SDR family NAD(P)-dependent oxidoreductase [Oceanibacterium hippocampi]SLN40736.1 2-dehydro-3-deoxy-D-gluconate 5-dehydrogenase [Oceanibacterium hippocampi]
MAYKAFDLSGRVALVTGGNGGIGLAMAEAMAEAGADICIWGTSEAKNAAALEKLAAHGTKTAAMRCDVSDEAAVDRTFAETVERFGRVDGCFANAGVSSGKNAGFTEMTTEEWRRVMSINMDGAFYTLRAAARHMTERAANGDAFGRLVGTASLAAISGAARNEHYAATKGGLISMIRALSVELARHQITANAILPGWIETEMTERSFGWDKFAAAVKPRIPARRWGQPEDFGAIAVYIMSTASSYHTGDTFLIDGGYFLF